MGVPADQDVPIGRKGEQALKPTLSVLNEAQALQRDAFVDRMLQSASGVFDIFTIYMGDRLGYYRALANGNPLTSAELASRTGTHERYTREWLEQQTVAGIVEVVDAQEDATARRFRLPAGHAQVLVERENLNYLAPLAQLVVGVTRPLDAVLDAYRHGGGVSLGAYGPDFLEGQAGINRSSFLYELGTEWLPAIPDIHARLQAEPPARIADIGCGVGWSSIGMARAYPSVKVDGFDLDAPSIERAQANALDSDLNGHLSFHVRDAGDPSLAGNYDLVIALECIHDMSDPVSALRSMRKLADPDGAVIIGDERVGETFTPTGNDVEWMMYGWSVLHCLPVGMADGNTVGTGAVMRAETLQHYALDAGFGRIEVLPIENFFFRFYRLHV
ncbi:class I SAM-dependent methyltransferase [Chloroflexota bacterium]